ncbi:cell division protein FtsZ [candidate division MSBL1 archaeon SCGC-AAA382A20]|uniref:Cell division protein FtsZ n=2 Tax=candidate division MSBL1 TaxID=215777 RepID=A0A133VKX0_9EURY|nr:cell division protein FtsZ [candidate division MSBL1 archaeon SCGC-AAA382A13]KXB07081.1 cell division protein FtsZ [candidate division MSBL1 archaeon SCGC-AAA382A20]
MRMDDQDEELRQTLEETKASILAVGCGGAGGNTISRFMETKPNDVNTLAINTDAQDLLYANADDKALIGREITGGRGAGNDPDTGREAALESRDDLKERIRGANFVFVTCGLGGGTGTGASPVVAKIAKRQNALTVAVVTLPFEVEGERRRQNAKKGLDELKETVDTVVIIPDDNILKIAPDLPIARAFKVADEILINTIRGISELITKPGLINLDFADIRNILEENGIAKIGVGEADGENRSTKAAEDALKSPLLDTDISNANKALVNIRGDSEMKLEEAQFITEQISSNLSYNAQITWGAYISDDLEDRMQVLLLIPDVDSPWAHGTKATERKEALKEIEEKLKHVGKS